MKKLWPILVAILVVIVAFNCVFTVNEGESALVLQFGHVERADYEPGLHVKIPFVQQVVRLDNRILSLDAQPERYFTKEKKSVDVDFYVKWRIVDNVTFYRSTTGNMRLARQRLAPIIKDALRFEINSRSLKELISGGRKDITRKVLAKVNKTSAENLGIKMLDLRVKQIELPDTVSDSIYQRMRAERKQLANKLRSTGKEAGAKIRSEADRKRRVLIANAKRDAAKVRGKGDARAASLYADAYSGNTDFFDFYRSLQAYNTAFSGKTALILDPDSDFMRYFKDPDGHGGQ